MFCLGRKTLLRLSLLLVFLICSSCSINTQLGSEQVHALPGGLDHSSNNKDCNHASNADIWTCLRQTFRLQDNPKIPAVQRQIQWYLDHHAYLESMAKHAAPYTYFILQQVKAKDLPGELVLLPFIESAFNPFAYADTGAAGLWQFMPSTASGFGIRQNWWYDGRRDIAASTHAALNYLDYLHNLFD